MSRYFMAFVLLLAVSASASAQQETPRAEVFGGYSWAGGNFHGFDTSVTINMKSWFGAMADLSGHYGSERDGLFEERQRALSFLFGPRFSLRKSRRFTPFVYALFGGVNFKTALSASGRRLIDASDTGFNLALGGGLDVKVSGRLAIRAFQLDYLRPSFFGEAHNRGRLAFGLVLRLGRRKR